jgi:hypothetical protein
MNKQRSLEINNLIETQRSTTSSRQSSTTAQLRINEKSSGTTTGKCILIQKKHSVEMFQRRVTGKNSEIYIAISLFLD